MSRESLDVRFLASHRPVEQRAGLRDEISKQIERFLAAGGQIEQVPTGIGSSNKAEYFREYQTPDAPADGSTRSLTQAAKFLGTSRYKLQTMINQGKGPPCEITMLGMSPTYKFRMDDLFAFKKAKGRNV